MNKRPHQHVNQHSSDLGALEGRLRAERPAFSTGLDFAERVMERLGPRERKSPAHGTGFGGWRWFIGLAAGTAAVVLALQITPGRLKSDAGSPTHPVEAAELKVPGIALAKVDALTARLEDPLEKELKYVISDTRMAIQFVAANFLPDNP